jgi:serine phosphatase RsbU (regulator of sigma subunit)/uncharacterized protein YigA (DUF484 family)
MVGSVWERLHTVTAALAQAWTLDEVASAVVESTVRATDAVGGRIVLLATEGAAREELFSAGDLEGSAEVMPVPLVAGGRRIGFLELAFAGQAPLDDNEVKFLLTVGIAAAHAIERAKLYEEDQSVRAEAQRAHTLLARLQVVTDAALSHLDLDSLLEELLTRVRSVLGADNATVLLLTPSGDTLFVRASSGLQAEVDRQVPVAVGRGFSGTIAATREPLFVEEVRRFPVVSPVLSQNVRSLMGVPLMSEGRLLGVLHVGTREPHSFTAEDLEFLLRVSDRTALAIRNAQLYDERDRIARTLQESLLPGRLPEIPGIELGAAYRPAGFAVDVGGDFYDVFDTGDGGWAAVIGDVCGKGADAAALTGFARHAVRTAALRDRRPSEILHTINEAMIRQDFSPQFMTMAYVRVRPGPQDTRLTVASGGHPLPLVVRNDGTVETAGSPGTLVGVFDDPELVDAPADLKPGESLVLYTDGVVEGGIMSEDHLRILLGSLAGKPAIEIAEYVVQLAADVSTEDRRDDMAVLVLRLLE